jgi:hypothetical protein
MRYLNPVGQLEKFVASGLYTHYQNGAPMGIVEQWSIHEQPDGAWVMRVDMDGRDIKGRSTLIEAWRSPAGSIERFDIQAFGAKTDPVQEVRASYQCYDEYVEIGRSVDQNPRQYEEIPLPRGYLSYPGTHLFLGMIVAQTAARGEPTAILTYDPRLDDTTAFEAETYTMTAAHIEDEAIEVGRRRIEAGRYERLVPFYDVLLPHLWIDTHQVLLRHGGPEAVTDVRLSDYARRPPPKRH